MRNVDFACCCVLFCIVYLYNNGLRKLPLCYCHPNLYVHLSLPLPARGRCRPHVNTPTQPEGRNIFPNRHCLIRIFRAYLSAASLRTRWLVGQKPRSNAHNADVEMSRKLLGEPLCGLLRFFGHDPVVCRSNLVYAWSKPYVDWGARATLSKKNNTPARWKIMKRVSGQVHAFSYRWSALAASPEPCTLWTLSATEVRDAGGCKSEMRGIHPARVKRETLLTSGVIVGRRK